MELRDRSVRRLRHVLRGAPLAALAIASACSTPYAGTCTDTQPCDAVADGGAEGASNVVLPAGCDLTKPLADSPACIDDSVAVFVAPSGNDTANGAKATPVKSLVKGLALAGARGLPRVYVCEGLYPEAAEIIGAVSVLGGLSCTWTYSGAKPKVAPPKGVALRISRVALPIVIEDLDLESVADKDVPGSSAIGVFVSGSANVTFRRVVITAGAASSGANGAMNANYTLPATQGGIGLGNGGAGPLCTCVDGTTSKGGNGAGGGGQGLTSGSASPAVGGLNAGLTGSATCSPGTVGVDGDSGAAGAVPSPAGTLSVDGWDNGAKPATAPNGQPAQGGGGGGAKVTSNSAGGGGGCGGCGGAGGSAGGNGGSSFALLSFDSTVVVEGQGSLASLAAGPGGAGGPGEAGQAGTSGGLLSACGGGRGGAGAGGSGGTGGAGGHSAPVAFVGPAPRVTDAVLTAGTSGIGGPPGVGGAGPGKPGATGIAGSSGKAQSALGL